MNPKLDSVFSANKRANSIGLELLAEFLTIEQLVKYAESN
jgi:hypothetical protein